MKSDRQIQQDVLGELGWDSRVEPTGVGVEVDQGVVTLTGTVDSFAKKLAAQAAAHRVGGVRDVANDIRVRVPCILGHTDTEVAKAVRHALEWDVWVPHERISSTVINGVVTLEGAVDRWRQREEVERTVRHLAGVVDVVNAITVKPEHPVDPDVVRQAIEDALTRRADREAERIRVFVEDGTVTLIGSVHTWPEKRAVLGAAGHAPGVVAVADHLRIDPYA
jgi:osmotically-inducible protein OsmY